MSIPNYNSLPNPQTNGVVGSNYHNLSLKTFQEINRKQSNNNPVDPINKHIQGSAKGSAQGSAQASAQGSAKGSAQGSAHGSA